MLKVGFSKTRANSELVRCVLRPPYSSAMLTILNPLFPKILLPLGLKGLTSLASRRCL